MVLSVYSCSISVLSSFALSIVLGGERFSIFQLSFSFYFRLLPGCQKCVFSQRFIVSSWKPTAFRMSHSSELLVDVSETLFVMLITGQSQVVIMLEWRKFSWFCFSCIFLYFLCSFLRCLNVLLLLQWEKVFSGKSPKVSYRYFSIFFC